jgi:hypothetical protein
MYCGFQKNQTNTAGNWYQTCSDIFCGKYISMKGSKKINPIRREEIHLSCVKHGFQQNSKGSKKINPIRREGFQKNQTNTAGNQFQTCSDIFCGKYVSMKIGSKTINLIRREEIHLSCVKHGFQQNSLICQKSRSKQSWQTKKIIGLKVPGHGLNGTVLKMEHQ